MDFIKNTLLGIRRFTLAILCFVCTFCAFAQTDGAVVVDSVEMTAGNETASVNNDPMIRYTVGVLIQAFPSEDHAFIGGLFYYSLKNWLSVGGTVGGVYHKFWIDDDSPKRITRPYIEPVVSLNLPHVWRIGNVAGVIPLLQVGMPVVPSYKVKKSALGGVKSYSTHWAGVNFKAGIVLGCGMPIYLGYMCSTVDDRKWNPDSQSFKRRLSHGIFGGFFGAF